MGTSGDAEGTMTGTQNANEMLREARQSLQEAAEAPPRDAERLPAQGAELGLRRILDISRAMNSTLDLEVLLSYVIDRLIEFFQAERGFLILVSTEGELDYTVAHNLEQENIKGPDIEVSHTIIRETVETREPTLVENAMEDPRFEKMPSVRRLELNSVMCAPLMARGNVVGVIYVDNRAVAGRFAPDDLELLVILASQAGVAVENAKLFAEVKAAQDHMVRTEKLRALGQMAAGVAHDFNNVLAIILGRTQLLLKRELDDEHRRELSLIEKAAVDGDTTIRRIQQYVKGGTEKTLIQYDLSRLVKDVIEMTRPRWCDTPRTTGLAIDVKTDLQPGLTVKCNPSSFREALTNLIFNAVDAMPKGGTIRFRTGARDGKAILTMADTGVGMTPDVVEHAFDPFFTTKGFNGSGLGLSEVYGIITRHQGEIAIDSAVGEGTTVRITLELVAPAPVPEVEPEEPEPRTGARVLIVDDDEGMREVFAMMLAEGEHEAVTVATGREGIEAVERNDFHIVFTDLGMPRMSGWEVAKSVKKLRPKTIVGLLTGWGVELDDEKVKKAGVDLVVAKPVRLEEFLRIVDEALELKGLM